MRLLLSEYSSQLLPTFPLPPSFSFSPPSPFDGVILLVPFVLFSLLLTLIPPCCLFDPLFALFHLIHGIFSLFNFSLLSSPCISLTANTRWSMSPGWWCVTSETQWWLVQRSVWHTKAQIYAHAFHQSSPSTLRCSRCNSSGLIHSD